MTIAPTRIVAPAGASVSAGAHEIGFAVPEIYNASSILFDNLAAGRGDKVAVYAPSGNATYGALCAEASRFGHALASLDLRAGDRILLFLNDTPAYVSAFFGAVRAGFAPILANTLSTRDLIRFFIEDAAVRVAVVDAEHLALFDTETIAGTTLEALIVVNGDAASGLVVPVHTAAAWLPGFPTELPAAPTKQNDPAFWMYSSGSTGRPKGIVHRQRDMAYTAASYARGILRIDENDICFSVPKIFFAYGFGNSITFPFSVGAASVLYPGRPEPNAVIDCVERFRPTLFFGLPTLYNAVLGHSRAATADFSSVRMCLSAAEVLSQELFDGWSRRFGIEVIEGLGSTEVLHIYLSNSPERKKIGTAGQRVPGYEIKLTTPDGQPVTRGEPGVMWVRGDSNSPYYWNRPDKTEVTMRDGWIWTGDRLVEDEDGFFTFIGRADELIKVSGQWVYPVEVELCLFEHPAVRECAVLGVELADRRMSIKAFVVLNDGYEAGAAMTRQLQDYVKVKLLPHKYPRAIDYVDELPKTGTGKIDRQGLKNRA